jgi:phosphatidylglycerol:prolipoprotein diacylglycerol transferase
MLTTGRSPAVVGIHAMMQVLFRIPIPGLEHGLPIYGFGAMLFVTFVTTVWIAGRRAKLEGINPNHIADLAFCLFATGVLGARIVYVWQYNVPWQQFFNLMDGGIVFYGSFIGGLLGGLGFHWFVIRKERIAFWLLADVVAPTVALGVGLGRLGCLMNGCCYGGVCPADVPAIHFPLLTAPAQSMLVPDYQTLLGFHLHAIGPDAVVVGQLEPGSAAHTSGIQPGDRITHIDGQPVGGLIEISARLGAAWPRGKRDVQFTVERDGKSVTLLPYIPLSLGLHPTQLYETLSMVVLFVFLSAFYHVRRHNGQVFVLLMLGYAVHRFFNEMLRNDTTPVAFGLTLSQNISICIFVAGIILEAVLWNLLPHRTTASAKPK